MPSADRYQQTITITFQIKTRSLGAGLDNQTSSHSRSSDYSCHCFRFEVVRHTDPPRLLRFLCWAPWNAEHFPSSASGHLFATDRPESFDASVWLNCRTFCKSTAQSSVSSPQCGWTSRKMIFTLTKFKWFDGVLDMMENSVRGCSDVISTPGITLIVYSLYVYTAGKNTI